MRIAIIGAGKMGMAIANALDECIIIDKNDDFENLTADVIVFAIKPQLFEQVLPSYKGKGKVYISIAAGITIAKMKSLLGENAHIIRTMPNLATSIQAGTTAICKDDLTTNDEFEKAMNIFNKFGVTIEVVEKHMDTVVALSGSSPAYVFMLLSAMIDFGIHNGLDYNTGLKLSANAIIGAMELALKSDKSAQELTDVVCSPNGTTIEAVNHLKENSFEHIIKNAMEKCKNRSEELAKN